MPLLQVAILLCLQLLPVLVQSIVVDERYNWGLRYNVNLDSAGSFNLFWDFDNEKEQIYFKLIAKRSKDQFIGFGFSDYGEFKDADFMVFWTDMFGKHHFQDAHTTSSAALDIDSQQDYTLDKVDLGNSAVILDFHRKFDTCDDDDYQIDTGTTHLVFFSMNSIIPTLRGINASRLAGGLQRVQLRKSQLQDPPTPHETQEFTMHVDNVTIPAKETTYWCKVKKLPKLRAKHHVVRFEGAISPQSQGIVHHLEVFHCLVPPGHHIPEHDAACKSMAERPPGLESCRRVIGAWAMGADGLTYPPQAGYPLGGNNFQRYVMLEVHYNNPERKAGIVDSSGIRFHITSNLRKYDAGVMELGMEYTDKYALPPGLNEWNLEGYCVPQCTNLAFPYRGIRVFASQLHTHKTGKSVITKHSRGGVELPPLNEDVHYSPHYQEIRKLQKHVTVLPGDSLTTICTDSTKNKRNVTLGGFAISDEMCVNYIHYYPRVDLEVCKSSVTTSALYDYFRFLNKYQGEKTSDFLGIQANWKKINWTPMNVRLLRSFMDQAPLSMQCNKSDGSRFPGEWEDIKVPKILTELPVSPRNCAQNVAKDAPIDEQKY